MGLRIGGINVFLSSLFLLLLSGFAIGQEAFLAEPAFDGLVGEKFSKIWAASKEWKGALCKGGYSYTGNTEAILSEVQIKIEDAETLLLYADFETVSGFFTGRYKSGYSACVTLKGGMPFEITKAQALVRIHFDSKTEKLSLAILETAFGHIHLVGSGVPRWFEDFLTKMVNGSLKYVWKSRLGDWINQKISKKLQESIPKE